MEKQKKSGPTNDPATFPELNLQTLQGYAELWAEMFPAIQRITLYRSDKGVVSSRYILFVQILYQINHELITALRPAKTEEDRKENEMIRSLLYADKYSQVTLQYLDWSCGHESADHVMDQLGDCYKERQTDLTYRDEWFWLTGSIEDPLPSEFILEHGGVLFEKPNIGLSRLVEKAIPEVELLYAALKDVGFSGNNSNANDATWNKAALQCFDENKERFRVTKREDLEDKSLYAFAEGQEARDFKGGLLQRIAESAGFGKQNARDLYKLHKQNLSK